MVRVETGVRGNNDDIDRMCRELFWEVEQQLIMHKLAKDYFGFRAFWLQSWPLLLITTFITIISFTEYGSITFGSVDDDEYFESRQRLALSLGILGLLSTFLTVLIINTRYQSQHDMHAMAERSLGKICQSVRFPERVPGDDGTRIVEQINKQKAIFMSVACTSSNIPTRIIHAFRDLEHIMDVKPYTFRAIQYERFYYFLWKLITKRSMGYFTLWPLKIPEINISTSVLGKMIDEEYARYNRGLEAATKRTNLISRRRSTSTMRTSASDEEQILHSSTASSPDAAEV